MGVCVLRRGVENVWGPKESKSVCVLCCRKGVFGDGDDGERSSRVVMFILGR